MNYLLDRKAKKNKFWKIFIVGILFIALFYFRDGVFNVLSRVSGTFFRPISSLGNGAGNNIENFFSYFVSKNFLYRENETLRLELATARARMANYDSIRAENNYFKETLGRRPETTKLLAAAILSKPNQSPYDTLVLDVGVQNAVEVGDIVYALGNIPIGRVDTVYGTLSKVVLFSSPGEKTQVVVGEGIFMELVGRGGGNFEMVVPRDFALTVGSATTLPGLNPSVVALVERIISDPRDPFTKALLLSPVNIQELKFVEIGVN